MTSVDISELIMKINPSCPEKFIAHINESINNFKTKYLEVFGTVINDDQIRLLNSGLCGYHIYSKDAFNEEYLVIKPIAGKDGLKIRWSGYRDVYISSAVPEFPYRQVDSIYINGRIRDAIEYNIDGTILLELEWDDDYKYYVLQNNTHLRSYHAPAAFSDIEYEINTQLFHNFIKEYQNKSVDTTDVLPTAPPELANLLTGSGQIKK